MNTASAPSPAADDPDLVAAQSSELLDRRRIGQARALLGGALRRHPDHAGLLYEAARADYLADDNDDARGTLARLLATDPNHFDARFLLAWIELEGDNLAEAERLVLGLLREAPEAAACYAFYARVMLRALQFDKAKQLAAEGLRHAPHDESCLRVRVLCDLVDGRSTDSRALAQLVASDPNALETMRMVVIALVHANRSREALRLARELLRAQPNDDHLLTLVRSLRIDTHWTLWPMWPLQRWGWYGSIALWIAVVVLLQLLDSRLVGAFSALWLGYVAYSWVWPPLLKRWIARGD